MTWADIKFGSDDGEGFLINIREGKTQKSLLPVESLPELREILKAHFAKQVEAGHSVFPSSPVFVTATGRTDVEIARALRHSTPAVTNAIYAGISGSAEEQAHAVGSKLALARRCASQI